MNKRLLAEIDAAYRALETRLETVKAAVRQAGLECTSGWYNGHYARDGRGEFRRQAYPIPVVSVEKLCDIELGFLSLNITAKLSRAQALAFPYETLPPVRSRPTAWRIISATTITPDKALRRSGKTSHRAMRRKSALLFQCLW